MDTWATCFDSIKSSSGPQRLQIQFLQGPEDDSIESKRVAHVCMVVDIPINCSVRLLHLVPIYFLMLTFKCVCTQRIMRMCSFFCVSLQRSNICLLLVLLHILFTVSLRN